MKITSKGNDDVMESWFANLPNEVTSLYSWLMENTARFETFDLLANLCLYNHLHDSDQYNDYRGDKHFFVPEILALICLKGGYVKESTIPDEDFFPVLKEIQNKILKYVAMKDAMDSGMESASNLPGSNPIADISRTLEREAKVIRNPGLPDHHLEFSSRIFEPLKDNITKLYGFSAADSILIRNKISEFLQEKVQLARNSVSGEVNKLMKEITRYKKTKVYQGDTEVSEEFLHELSAMNYNEARGLVKDYFLTLIHLKLGEVYSFTAEELSSFTKIDIENVESFLRLFSCEFPSLLAEDEIHQTNSILKRKPIVHYEGSYLLVSIPLLFWAPEILFEEKIKLDNKLSARYSKIKHDFVLEQGVGYLKDLMPTAKVLPPNLFYTVGSDRCETDAIIIYDTVLFIIETKGHRISDKAKSGNRQRTENHLKQIVKESYEQGIRTLKYIEENDTAEFTDEKSEKFVIRKNDFDEIVIVSLTLEPIGNLVTSIRTTDNLGYFKHGHFPWIVSIYDLVVIRDMIENPFLFIHYLRQRKIFLSHNHVSVYEEADVLSYFLYNGLKIDHLLADADNGENSFIMFEPNTDAINDYYMYKFGKKEKVTKKPPCYLSPAMNDFLLQFDNSQLEHRVKVAMAMLQFENDGIKKFMDRVKITKRDFSRDRLLHDGSLFNDHLRIGMTHMTGNDKKQLDLKLYQYCRYKFEQLDVDIWVGISDAGLNPAKYDFTGIFFMSKKKPEML